MPNALHYGDNLAVLRDSIASESVDLVYLDPPLDVAAAAHAAAFPVPAPIFAPPANRASPSDDEEIRTIRIVE